MLALGAACGFRASPDEDTSIRGDSRAFRSKRDEHFFAVCRYVERNALRAGLVKRAEHRRCGSLWSCNHRRPLAVALADSPTAALGYDVSGRIARAIKSDAAGTQILLDALFSDFAFAGREWDGDAGRFLSEDPIGFAGGDANLYRYAADDPTNFRDPSGQNPLVALLVNIGIAYLDKEINGREGSAGFSFSVGTSGGEVDYSAAVDINESRTTITSGPSGSYGSDGHGPSGGPAPFSADPGAMPISSGEMHHEHDYFVTPVQHNQFGDYPGFIPGLFIAFGILNDEVEETVIQSTTGMTRRELAVKLPAVLYLQISACTKRMRNAIR